MAAPPGADPRHAPPRAAHGDDVAALLARDRRALPWHRIVPLAAGRAPARRATTCRADTLVKLTLRLPP